MNQLVYKITRPIARQALKVNFKSIYFSNVDNIPLDKPIILASNHPTAFVEPIIMACFLPIPVSYLVRGDFFKKKVIRKILEAYNMIPIYRFVDGFSNLKKNTSSFKYCYQALKNNRMIMIMVEGLTHHDKKLMPLQKGAARIAFDTISEYGTALDIKIVPVGVNYTDAPKFRSEVMIDFGQPISVNDYWDLYQKHPTKAIRQLTQDIYPAMKSHIIEIINPDDTILIERALELYRNTLPFRTQFKLSSSPKRLLAEKSIADLINGMSLDDKNDLQTKMDDYFNNLMEHKTTDFALAHPNFSNSKRTLQLMLAFLPAMLGRLLNFIPFAIGHYFSKKYITEIEFFTPVRLVLVFVEYIFIVLIIILIAFLKKKMYLVLLPIIMLLTGLTYLFFAETYEKRKQVRQFQYLSDESQKKLIAQRKELLGVLMKFP